MNRLVMSFAAAALVGCQTRITATKRPEQMLPVQRLAVVGTNATVYTVGYVTGSGGWEATARSPLWANEQFAKLAAAVNPDGTVSFGVDQYSRDLSTNAVAMTETLVRGAVDLTAKVAAAIVTSGGSEAASAATVAIQKLVAKFIAGGGNPDNAKIECKDGSCTITDGTTSCTDGACYPVL